MNTNFIGLDPNDARQPDAAGESARKPEIGKRYLTVNGERTSDIYAARENPFDAPFEATIPGSFWIAFYNENGESMNSGPELNLDVVLND